MNLSEIVIEATNAGIMKAGRDVVELTAGQYLQVRYGVIGDISLLFSGQVPVGKVWKATVVLNIKEEDA